MINREVFFASVRTNIFGGRITQAQVDGISIILTRWEAHTELTDKRWLAYMLATTFHETARTMQPIEEYGKGKGYKYGKNFKRSGVQYDYNKYPFEYYGRGFVQLTWFENYETMGRLLGVNLLENPNLALDPNIATDILFEGMTKGNSHFGDFTGKSLENYFTDKKEDWVNARKIINGLDCADKIAKHALNFYSALSA